jgi:glycosyltransferase involved in cell wall biosynthesis
MKKVLIISYYWPPAGGIGVLRCLKIAKYLRLYGWEPIIFTAENPHYPSIDHSNDKDIPEGITVIKQPIWEPYHIYKWITGKDKKANVNNVFYVHENQENPLHNLSVWIRSNFFIPDARACWINPSVRCLLDYLKSNPVQAIFSDGPPHSNTRIATLLKAKTNIPWLADFQDPWTQVDYFQLLRLTPPASRLHHRMEQEVFQLANKITIVSPSWKKDLESIGAKEVSVIPWGFDPDDYANIIPAPNAKFTIIHLGILGYDRKPDMLIDAIASLCHDMPGFLHNLEIKLVGQVDPSVTLALTLAGLSSVVVLTGNVDRVEALRMASSSSILLLLLNQQPNAQGRIPGKLFEYLALKRPILVLGPPEADAAQITTTANAGFAIDYADKAGMVRVLAHYYQLYLDGSLAQPVDNDISRYDIRLLTGEIAGLLDEITAVHA